MVDDFFKRNKKEYDVQDKHACHHSIRQNLWGQPLMPTEALIVKLHNHKARILAKKTIFSKERDLDGVKLCLDIIDPLGKLYTGLDPSKSYRLLPPPEIPSAGIEFHDNSSIIKSAPSDPHLVGKSVSVIYDTANYDPATTWRANEPSAQHATAHAYCQAHNGCAAKSFVIHGEPKFESIPTFDPVPAQRGANPAARATPATPPPRPSPPPQDESGFPTWAIILIIAMAILMVGGFALFFYIRKRTRSDLYY